LTFCMNRSLFEEDVTEDKIGYDSKVHVINREGHKLMERKETMNPAKLYSTEEKQIYIYSSLNFGADTYGYCVAAYDDRCLQDDKYRVFKEIVSVALESIKQKEELNRMNLKLQQLYMQDPMTGLYNRFGYINQADNYLQSHNNEIFLIYADVDNLKTINDNYGHEKGDQAIMGVAEAIKKVFGDECLCVRMGGDEFLIMDGSNREQTIIDKEQAVLDYARAYSERMGFPFTVCASMGHISSAENKESLDILVRRADQKMYEVKQERKRKIAEK